MMKSRKKDALIAYLKQLTPEEKIKMIPKINRITEKLRQGAGKRSARSNRGN
jgi:hypothetical protein